MKGFGGSFLGTGGRSILGRDRSVKISSTKLFWAFFFFQLLWFCTFFDDFWGFGEFMIEIMWDLNREQQLYDQRTQLLLICHWKFFSQFSSKGQLCCTFRFEGSVDRDYLWNEEQSWVLYWKLTSVWQANVSLFPQSGFYLGRQYLNLKNCRFSNHHRIVMNQESSILIRDWFFWVKYFRIGNRFGRHPKLKIKSHYNATNIFI